MLRGGIPCTVEVSRKTLSAMMGNQNGHVDITFEDGVKWLARFRLVKTSSPPQEVRDYIIRSEAATMTFLQQHIRIPTPRIFDWGCESDPENPLGVGYILMEKVIGKPLDWQAAGPAQREKIMQQLADMFLDIEKHPFEAMGSLVFLASEPTEFDLQGLAYCSTFRLGGDGPLGPFSSSLEGSRAILELYLTMISNGEINAAHPLDAYLAHRYRLDLANSHFSDAPPGEKFFLKHPEDKGDHIMINDSFDIVGVIDWEWTQTVSRAEAFSSPCMMWPVGKFYNGSNELAAEELRLADIFRERGREDLAHCVLGGRRVQRFFSELGVDGSFSDRKTFLDLFMGLRRAFGSGGGWEMWRSEALERWGGDGAIRGLLKLE